MYDWMIAALLGLLEGLTEFIPVSSTGHLLLAGHFLGFESSGKTFEVVIQLGAVLAILTLYGVKVATLLLAAAKGDGVALRGVVSVLLAFIPAVIIGLLAHDFIKAVLFETPMLIAVMLILGGVVLLFVDRMAPAPIHTDVRNRHRLCGCLCDRSSGCEMGAGLCWPAWVRPVRLVANHRGFGCPCGTLGWVLGR